MRIRITTTDNAFAAEIGSGLAEDKSTVITIADDKVERLTFAGRDMIRFDMAAVASGRLPKDWGNRYTMYPATRIS
jgi:hypothetical protein